MKKEVVELGSREIAVLNVLGVGVDNAITCGHLAARTNLTARDVRYIVNTLRLAGYTIVSDRKHGYWIAESIEDIEIAQRAIESQIMQMCESYRNLSFAKANIKQVIKEKMNGDYA